MTGITRVLAAVIQREDRFFVAQRPSHKRHGGLWEFPGGKVQNGESDLVALSRDLLEELGLAVSDIGAPLYKARDPSSRFEIVFLPATTNGVPRALEHADVFWGTPAEFSQMRFAPADQRFVSEVLLKGLG